MQPRFLGKAVKKRSRGAEGTEKIESKSRGIKRQVCKAMDLVALPGQFHQL